jgi:ubiquinone/menaquinone biosynthesis C-methylase UbiE
MRNIHSYRNEKDNIRSNLIKYTRKAYFMLPGLSNPQILDLGCGTGVPTIELAKLSKGNITAMDNDPYVLDRLQAKIKKSGLTERIRILKGSFTDIRFPDESFDLIWAEGSIFVLGFRNSLLEWFPFLKSHGFLVIHDEDKDKEDKLKLIRQCGYKLLGQFELSADCWWQEYFVPLESLIQEFRQGKPKNPELLNEMDQDQKSIDQGRADPDSLKSFYVILRKL